MMRHYFIVPYGIESLRWRQAFSNMVVVDEVPNDPNDDDFFWCYVTDKDFLEKINEVPRNVRWVAMTAKEDVNEARYWLSRGASGYVHYLAVPDLLASIHEAVMAGGVWLGVSLMQQLILSTSQILKNDTQISAKTQLTAEKFDFSLLTERERAVADLVAQGKTNKEVARDLDITERTVKAHLSSVFEKCQIRDRLHLVLAISGK